MLDRAFSRYLVVGVVVFAAASSLGASFAQQSEPASKHPLAGTSWQLVRFQASEGAASVPDERSKYTIEFSTNDRFAVRFDCNQGGGTWIASGANEIRFERIFLTPVVCPASPIYDRIKTQWALIRSFAIKNGRLFLTVASDGGVYEFERRGQ